MVLFIQQVYLTPTNPGASPVQRTGERSVSRFADFSGGVRSAGPSGEGEGEVSEWFMVLVLKTSVMQVTVGSNPTLSGFFWRCGQVVRQRIANSSLPSSNLGAAYVFCKNNFLIYSKRVVVVACLPTTKPLGQSAPLICPGPD